MGKCHTRGKMTVTPDEEFELIVCEVQKLEARVEQARDIISAYESATQDMRFPKSLRADTKDWLSGEWFEACSICRRRHRSDDRHPCE